MTSLKWILLLQFYSTLWLASASTNNGGFQTPAFLKPQQPLANSTKTSDKIIPRWKQQLPYPLNNKTQTLQRIIIPGPRNRTVEVYLLGTAHVSIDSSRDVDLLLEFVDPSVIFVELCNQRTSMLLTPDRSESNSTITKEKKRWWHRLKKPKRHDAGEGAKSLNGMAASMLTTMQKDFADSLGVELGGEFRVAYNYWEKRRTATTVHLILGDRPVFLTLTRAWESLGIWGKAKLLIALFISTLQKPNPDELREWMKSILADETGDLLSKSIEDLKKHFPTLEEVIIRERDAYMACKLYQTCRQLLVAPNAPLTQRLVAIVGAGHVPGMVHWLTVGNGKLPEEVLEGLIRIKKGIPIEDGKILIHDVALVNYEMMQEMISTEQVSN